MLVEYDLAASSFDGGLVLKGSRARTDQSGIPSTMAWYPVAGKEEFIMTVRERLRLFFLCIGLIRTQIGQQPV